MRKSKLFLVPTVTCAAALLASCAKVNLTTPSGTPYLYVASGAELSLPQPTLNGFVISADGLLTPTGCAPVASANLLAIVGEGSTMFASTQPAGPASAALLTFAISPNGCPSLQTTTDVTADGAPLSLFVDLQGQTLYSWVYRDAVTAELNSYAIDAPTGALQHTGRIFAGYPTYFGKFGTVVVPTGMLAFSPDDRFAVRSSFDPLDKSGIGVYQRSANGTLTGASVAAPNSPAGPGLFWSEGAAADNAGHFIVAGVVCTYSWNCPNSPIQLAVYTLGPGGRLSTEDTPQTMITPPSNGYEVGYAFSPDSRYFAVAAGGGLDVYLWDPTVATLRYLTSITLQGNGFSGDLVHAFTWDRYDHLIFTSAGFGQSSDSGEIQVYSVRDSGVAPAPGSPYPLSSPAFLTVANVSPPKPFKGLRELSDPAWW